MLSTSKRVYFMEINRILSIMLQLFILLSISVSGVFGLEPNFDVPIINVTVHEGSTAILPCSVDALGDHKVAWTDQWNTLLTLDDRRIIDDSRISIERPHTKDWNLHIRKADYSDRGQYTCQINTNPVKMKTVMLLVLVPSKIVNELSSRDQSVREGETVTLVCNVTGVPIPEVTWYKIPDDGSQAKERLDLDPGFQTFIDYCSYTLKQTEIGTSGEVLIIHNISRYCDGIYECVAYNDVDPAVARQIKVFVEFPPEVRLLNNRMGQYVGRETILDCEIVAYPHGQMYWTKDSEDIDMSRKDKYLVELYSGNEDSKRKTLSIRVKNIQPQDFGDYTCVAKNYLGSDRETILLYDYSDHNHKKVTTETSPQLQSTAWPPPELFPLSPNENGIDIKPNVYDANGVISYTRRPDFTPAIGGVVNGDLNKNRPYQTGEGSAALGGTGSAPPVSKSTFHFILSLIGFNFVMCVL